MFECLNWPFIILQLYSLWPAGNNSVSLSLALPCRDYPVITIWHNLSEQQSPWPNRVVLHSVWPEGFLFVFTTGTGQNVVWEWEGEVGVSGPNLFHYTGCGRVIVATTFCRDLLWQELVSGLTMRVSMAAAMQATITYHYPHLLLKVIAHIKRTDINAAFSGQPSLVKATSNVFTVPFHCNGCMHFFL